MNHVSKVLVDIPADKGVHIKSAGARGEKYVYQYTQYFRNSDGKPRNKAKSIGKFDVGTGKMFPNANYFTMFNVSPDVPDITLWEYGYNRDGENLPQFNIGMFCDEVNKLPLYYDRKTGGCFVLLPRKGRRRETVRPNQG